MAQTTLVTGATGLVGSALTRQLVEDGCAVRVFRRRSSPMDLLGPVAAEVEHAIGDVRDPRSLLRAMTGIDRVYHVAAKVSFAARNREALRRINVGGTANVVNAALEAGVERLVHTSSMAAFGRPLEEEARIDETTEWRDAPYRSAYAASKRDAELEIQRGIAEGLDAVIVNPALVFGTGRPGEGTRRLVDAVRTGWLPAVPEGGTNVVDVEDVAAGHRAAMEHGQTGRRYFLGSENLSWAEIAGLLAEAFGVEAPTRTVPSPLVWAGAYLAEAVAFVTRTEPILSRSTAHTATHTFAYENERARTELDCSFRPFRTTAQRIAADLRARGA